jgi:hypothetical protein
MTKWQKRVSRELFTGLVLGVIGSTSLLTFLVVPDWVARLPVGEVWLLMLIGLGSSSAGFLFPAHRIRCAACHLSLFGYVLRTAPVGTTLWMLYQFRTCPRCYHPTSRAVKRSGSNR